MRQTIPLAFFLVLSIIICLFIQQTVNKNRQIFLESSYMDYTLPSKFTSFAAMEFKGIVSDFLFLKVSTFFGQKFLSNEKLEKQQADYAFHSIDTITDLDPWFWDAYLFGDMLLAWDFGEPEMANELLLKARQYRTLDFKPPYYMGFNHFYFLKDNATASKFLMEASKLPGAPSYLFALASRLSVYQNQLRPAILFLKGILEKNKNPAMERQISTRLKALIILDKLEQKVRAFKSAHGVFPKTIDELVISGDIDTIPQDPYGGKFFILENGRVFTTSKLIFKND